MMYSLFVHVLNIKKTTYMYRKQASDRNLIWSGNNSKAYGNVDVFPSKEMFKFTQ